MNPFTPTFGGTPPLLVGRDDPLIDFRVTLGAAPGDPNRAILLTGIRGSGKTVLLNAFEDEARALRQPIENAGRAITDDALAAAGAATKGYPFLIQLIGYHIWAVDPASDTIDERQARAGVDRALRRVGRLVNEPALADLSAVDRSFLVAMSIDEGPSRMVDIAARLGVSRSYASQYRLRLIAAEAIVPAGRGFVDFNAPYLRDYLRQSTSGAAGRTEMT